ncbi:MAG: hypothetical protein Q7U59_12685 [Lutibacter sp.]|nr:hypothetical protein [Lutibacter sp.]
MSVFEIEKLRNEFSNIPINIEDEIEEDFYWWEKGTYRFDIWHWFDETSITNFDTQQND